MPYLTGAFAAGVTDVNGEPALRRAAAAPATDQPRPPGVRRLSLQHGRSGSSSPAGYTNISFDSELQTQAFSLLTGEQVAGRRSRTCPPAARSTSALASAALVYDNSFFGATGPILGQRYRLRGVPTVGSLNYVGVLADYRRYFMPVRPFTLAARLHALRPLRPGGEDPRLQPLFLGYPGLVRGYGYGSFKRRECHPPRHRPNGCPVFDQLLGSRMVVGNLELRFPLFGVLGVGLRLLRRVPARLRRVRRRRAGLGQRGQPSVSRVGDPRPGLQRRRRAARSTCSASRSLK